MEFWDSKLCQFFKKFVRRHYALFSEFGVGVRSHCMKLVVKHELSRQFYYYK